jgi:flavodoxin
MYHLKNSALYKTVFLTAITFLLGLTCSLAAEKKEGKTLILFYSCTGNTRMACKTLQKSFGIDMQEIKDLKNNPGKVTMHGGMSANNKKRNENKMSSKNAKGSMPPVNLVVDTEIAPATIDLTPYSHIILGSPIWMGSLTPAIRKFVATNNLHGKKVIIFTTSNAPVPKKRQDENTICVTKAGAEVVAFYQVQATQEVNAERVPKTMDQIVSDTMALVPEIRKALSVYQ